MELSIEAKALIKESFNDLRNGYIPEYASIIERDFEFQEIIDLIVQECTNIINLMDNMSLMVFSSVILLFDGAAGKLEIGNIKSVGPMGIAASRAHSILDGQPKHVKDKYADIANFFYGIIFGMIKDDYEIYDLGKKVNMLVDYAYQEKKEALVVIRQLKDEGKLSLEHPEKFLEIQDTTKYSVNHHIGLSVIIMTIVGTFLSTMGKSLLSKPSDN